MPIGASHGFTEKERPPYSMDVPSKSAAIMAATQIPGSAVVVNVSMQSAIVVVLTGGPSSEPLSPGPTGISGGGASQ